MRWGGWFLCLRNDSSIKIYIGSFCFPALSHFGSILFCVSEALRTMMPNLGPNSPLCECMAHIKGNGCHSYTLKGSIWATETKQGIINFAWSGSLVRGFDTEGWAAEYFSWRSCWRWEWGMAAFKATAWSMEALWGWLWEGWAESP